MNIVREIRVVISVERRFDVPFEDAPIGDGSIESVANTLLKQGVNETPADTGDSKRGHTLKY